jgi:hypothetical protein
LLAAICSALDVELSELFTEVSQTLRREEKLALADTRVALVGAGSARLGPAGRSDSAGGAQVRTLPTVAA